MKKRPLPVTIISWYLIVTSGLALIAVPFSLSSQLTKDYMAQVPVPIPVQYAVMFIGLAILAVCGIAMLKGFNWGRVLYIIWQLLALTYTLTTSPIRAAVVPGSIIYIVIVFFILNKSSNEYFSSTETETEINTNA